MSTKKMVDKIEKSNGICAGAFLCDGSVVFTAYFQFKESLYLRIYNTLNVCIADIDMSLYKVSGNVYSVKVSADGIAECSYEYVVDGEVVSDPYERNHQKIRVYSAKLSDATVERSKVYVDNFEWNDDKTLNHKYSDVIAYSLHVRGFTKHKSSKVKGNGTYTGIIEKIPYLKELGINQIELMPSYEFYEIDTDEDALVVGHPKYAGKLTVNENGEVIENKAKEKINYWGYKEGHYFCPKANYALSDNFVNEYKKMVYELHKAGIEVVMQFYFPKNVNRGTIIDVLRFWRLSYHIDGFHIMGENIPKNLIISDPVLSEAKLYFEYIGETEISPSVTVLNKSIAEVSKAFLTDARRFLKSDDGSLYNFVVANRYNPTNIHRINYISCYEGFTLNDLVSYDYKHNELNGEDNRDGTDYNYSWNCGVEGASRKRNVQALRLRQMKNAMCLLLLSQSTPMLLMGDELMNSQGGNNNPYCQDNEITWLNWNITKSNKEFFNFVKELIAFRKDNKMLHLEEEPKLIDHKSLGFPDVSYHQDMAWKSRFDSFMKHVGILYAGEYLDGEESLYIAYNMHWENHLFGLPKLTKGKKWKFIFTTSDGVSEEDINKDLSENNDELCVLGRSVLVLKSISK
ncbi:MAG: hypothetical protein Q4E51_04515 [Lachnospiraceae bacterium]|nr:hypothetical protein [Lachnospiraceae bacterium]